MPEVEENVKNRDCIKCGLTKNESDFIKDKSRKSGFHPYCKLCQNKYKFKNSKLNKDRASKWNKENPERRKEIKSKWIRNNKHITSYHRQLRRKIVKDLSDGTITPNSIKNLPKEICGICNKKLDWNIPSEIHLDHIRPLILKGRHSINNVQWSHAKCNQSKGGRLQK